jgi:hypothetical protein
VTLYACDFFGVEVLGLFGTVRTMVFFVIELKSRAVNIAGVRIAPDGERVADPGVAPARVVAGKLKHQVADVGSFARPARIANLRAVMLCAASWRNQARIVCGRTIWQQARRSSAVSALPLSARRRRCSALKSIRVLPVAAAAPL